jgi:acyl-CoA thioesterase I
MPRVDGPQDAASRGISRRQLLLSAPGALLAACRRESNSEAAVDATLIYTFGDSILDCGRYNRYGVNPGQLIVQNDDNLFPEFKGRDLKSRGPASLDHRAVDGATVADLPRQARVLNLAAAQNALALLTVGGNDLIRGLARDSGPGMLAFEAALARFLRELGARRILLGNVYDPTVGDDAKNFLGVDARTARGNHRRMNDIIAALAERHGRLVDLHAHFLSGSPAWFTNIIEPSLIGASEVRRAFLAGID